jgi:hypothetical protein
MSKPRTVRSFSKEVLACWIESGDWFNFISLEYGLIAIGNALRFNKLWEESQSLHKELQDLSRKTKASQDPRSLWKLYSAALDRLEKVDKERLKLYDEVLYLPLLKLSTEVRDEVQAN